MKSAELTVSVAVAEELSTNWSMNVTGVALTIDTDQAGNQRQKRQQPLKNHLTGLAIVNISRRQSRIGMNHSAERFIAQACVSKDRGILNASYPH